MPRILYTGDARSAESAARATADAIEGVGRATDRANEKLDETEEQTEGAFGSASLAKIGKFSAGILGVRAAAQLATLAIREMNQAGDEAAASHLAGLAAAGETQQLGPAGGRAAREFGEQLIEMGVVPEDDRAQAMNIGFRLVSGFFGDDERYEQARTRFAQIAAQRFVSPANLPGFIGATSKLQAQFGGDIGLITDELAAASAATGADITRTGLAALRFGGEARAVDFDRQQVLASLSTVEQQTRDIDVAATQLRQFFIQIRERGLAGATMAETLGNIERAGGPAVLSEANAFAAATALLQGRETYAEQLGLVRGAEGRIQRDFTTLLEDPAASAALLRTIEEGRLATAKDPMGIAENQMEAARARIRRGALEFPVIGGRALEVGARGAFWMADMVGADDIVTSAVGTDEPGAQIRALNNIDANTEARTATVEE